MADRNALLKQIGETSFTLDELRLYLDTHPLDENAMNAYAEHADRRRQLLNEYADRFEPLTCDCICTETNGSDGTKTQYPGQKHWTWADGPIPWDTEANAYAESAAGTKGGI